MSKKRAVVSFATGHYVKSLLRMNNILLSQPGRTFDVFPLRHLPPGCAEHSIIPYQFKPYAIKELFDQGYTSVLWMDSVILPQQPLEPVFDIIEQEGYLVMLNGWDSGQWCCDSALEPLGITREEAFKIPQAMACILGFDMSRPDVLSVFNQWLTDSPYTFPGPWSNRNGEASSDQRVLGHRHDQTAISIYAHRAGWKFTPPDHNRLIKYGFDESYILNSYPV